MTYLIKATLIWSILLLVYEAFLKNSGRYLANRLWLCGGLLLGALLPLVRSAPAYVANSRIVRSEAVQWVTGEMTAAGPAPAASGTAPVLWMQLIIGLYVSGVLVVFITSLREVGIILKHAVYGRFTTISGSKVFFTERRTAPYSFMGWVFISTHTPYKAEELDFVLAHEAAHNRQRHWLDLLLIQCIYMLFWFHPLVWRSRFLLRLQHEYEADELAARGDAYTYGHFLLQQTLLKGTPFVAHSFHFSPIKNRIYMLTKDRKTHSGWKYLLAIPAIFSCTFLMAQATHKEERVRTGDKTVYQGNAFYWSKTVSDTLIIEDPVTGEQRTMVQPQEPQIIRMNREPVIDNKSAAVPAQFRNGNKNYGEYLKDRLTSRGDNIPDSIGQIQVNKIVLSKEGRIVYYELLFLNAKPTAGSYYTYHPSLSPILEQIIADGPDWLPASKDGSAVPAFVERGGAIMLKPISFTFQSTGPAQKVINQKGAVVLEGKEQVYEQTNSDGTKSQVKTITTVTLPAAPGK